MSKCEATIKRRSYGIGLLIASCHVNLMTAPGEATIARLNRKEGKYWMTIIPAALFDQIDWEKAHVLTTMRPIIGHRRKRAHPRQTCVFG